MSFLKKLFGSGKQMDKKKTVYKSSDNVSTTYTDYKEVDAAWRAQGMMFDKGSKVSLTMGYSNGNSVNRKLISKGHPFICYTFKTEETAKKGLSSISFIKTASDTNEFISLEVLEFGCYETETKGLWEVIIWGANFNNEMFNESASKLSAAGGMKKGERVPLEKKPTKPKPTNKAGKATYDRTDKQGPNTYEVYKAPSQSVALEFLKNKPVSKPLYYVIIETPEGNWGKDKDGIYQE